MIMDKPQTHCSNLWSKERGKGSSAKGSFPISINTKIQLIAVMVLTHVFQSVRFYVHCSLLFLQRHKMSLLVFFAIKINQFNINLQDVIVPMLSTRAGISHLLFSQVLKDLGSSLLLSGAHRWALLCQPGHSKPCLQQHSLKGAPKVSKNLWARAVGAREKTCQRYRHKQSFLWVFVCTELPGWHFLCCHCSHPFEEHSLLPETQSRVDHESLMFNDSEKRAWPVLKARSPSWSCTQNDTSPLRCSDVLLKMDH